MESPIRQLQERKQELLAHFVESDEPDFLTTHTDLLDDYFRESFARSSVGPCMGMEKNPYAIIALGGYGRKEQCLHSDVDVLLLFKKKITESSMTALVSLPQPLDEFLGSLAQDLAAHFFHKV